MNQDPSATSKTCREIELSIERQCAYQKINGECIRASYENVTDVYTAQLVRKVACFKGEQEIRVPATWVDALLLEKPRLARLLRRWRTPRYRTHVAAVMLPAWLIESRPEWTRLHIPFWKNMGYNDD